MPELELILRYSGDSDALRAALQSHTSVNSPAALPSLADAVFSNFIPLLAGFAIIRIPAEFVPALTSISEIYYIEPPSTLFYADTPALRATCIPPLAQAPYDLTGSGVLMGIADSGIDLTHPDFQNAQGQSRILVLWDQTAESAASPAASEALAPEVPYGQVFYPARQNLSEISTYDPTGHGTAVAGLAVGNGRASGGRFSGAAPGADLAFVKLASATPGGFPRTTQLLCAVDFLVRTAQKMEMPLVLNLSYGNNYGAHNGSSILEQYLDAIASYERLLIVTGSGNELASAIHTTLRLVTPEPVTTQFAIPSYQTTCNLQIWCAPEDQFRIELHSPSGESVQLPAANALRLSREYTLHEQQLAVFFEPPAPFNPLCQYFLTFYPDNSFLPPGIWTIRIEPVRIRTGIFECWFSDQNTLQPGTRFYNATPETTVTIPGTARSVLTVGAWDSARQSLADFSGIGPTTDGRIKPDLLAPGVSLTAPAPGGGYRSVTGTSFAAPIASGTAALLMEWGIIRGNNPFLYGERLKAQFKKGAVPLNGNNTLPILSPPDIQTGYGTLCARSSLPDEILP